MSLNRAVIFDLDDTLYPEKSYQKSGFRAVIKYLKDHNIHITLNELIQINRKYPQKTFDQLTREKKIDLGATSLIKAYRTHVPSIVPFRTTVPLLRKLQRKGYKLGVLTDHLAPMQRQKIKALKLSRFFDTIIYTDALKMPKPETRAFLLALNRLGTRANRAVYVGDNPQKDFIGARKIGMHTIHINYKSGVYAKIAVSKGRLADFQIASLHQIPNILEKINSLI